MGKPVHAGLEDVQAACDISNFFAGQVETAMGESSVNLPDFLSVSLRQPYGVVAAIVPWNFPTMLVIPGYPIGSIGTD